ncbi:hypothetical protein CNYM01_13741 [Colletotrichum nymphaeae SA-01]|uniref:Uncharacterized protein n=1 Tax=Colletotrichum nymphaeae SA-01 TaxID=1460502 RepID=A0A135TTD8_9PEZI|nr:hypothetical protein CNYM01_13741 [Colletotrichum nymphaeae SA-01]
MVSQIESRRRVVGDWDFLQQAPATSTQKPTRSHGLSFDGEATVPVRSGKMTADLSRLVCKGRLVGERYWHSRLGLRRPFSEEKGHADCGRSRRQGKRKRELEVAVGCRSRRERPNAADPPLASRGQQCETHHLGAKPATASMQGGLEDTFFDRVDSADTIDNQDADSDVDGLQVAMRRTGLIRSGINFRRKGCALVLRRDAAGRQSVLIVVYLKNSHATPTNG